MTVRRLLAETDSRELTEWQAYERVAGPLGGDRGDVQAAIVAATIANVHRGKEQQAMKLSDFLPQWGGPRKQTWQEILDVARSAFGTKKED